MNTLHTVYRILYSLDKELARAEFKGALIGPDALGIAPDQWLAIIKMLLADGYIRGVVFKENVLGQTEVDIENIAITMRGEEYLHENGAMQKLGRIVTNVINIAK